MLNFFENITKYFEIKKFKKLNTNKLVFKTPESLVGLKHANGLLQNKKLICMLSHSVTPESKKELPISCLEDLYQLVTYINPFCAHYCTHLVPKKYLFHKLRKALVGYGTLYVPFNSRFDIDQFNAACATATRILKGRKKYINKVLVLMYVHSLEKTSNKLSMPLLVKNLKYLEKQKLKSHLAIAHESNIFTTRYK